MTATDCRTKLDNDSDGAPHYCKRVVGHEGSHRCECGYVWFREGKQS